MTRPPRDVLLPIGILLIYVGVLTLGWTAVTAFTRSLEPQTAAERACDSVDDGPEWSDCLARELAEPRWSYQGLGWSLILGGLGGLSVVIALLGRRPLHRTTLSQRYARAWSPYSSE